MRGNVSLLHFNFFGRNVSWTVGWSSTLLYPIHREGAILQSPCPSVHTFVTDISASTGRNDFIFDIWLWHGDLYRVSSFQVYRTSTSCLQCDLRIFHVCRNENFRNSYLSFYRKK